MILQPNLPIAEWDDLTYKNGLNIDTTRVSFSESSQSTDYINFDTDIAPAEWHYLEFIKAFNSNRIIIYSTGDDVTGTKTEIFDRTFWGDTVNTNPLGVYVADVVVNFYDTKIEPIYSSYGSRNILNGDSLDIFGKQVNIYSKEPILVDAESDTTARFLDITRFEEVRSKYSTIEFDIDSTTLLEKQKRRDEFYGNRHSIGFNPRRGAVVLAIAGLDAEAYNSYFRLLKKYGFRCSVVTDDGTSVPYRWIEMFNYGCELGLHAWLDSNKTVVEYVDTINYLDSIFTANYLTKPKTFSVLSCIASDYDSIIVALQQTHYEYATLCASGPWPRP